MIPDEKPKNHMELEGKFCRMLYEKYGGDVLPVIEDVFREFGDVIGEKLSGSLADDSFYTGVMQYLKPVTSREPKPEITQISEDCIEMKVFTCPFNLQGAGEALCEAMTELDRAILGKLLSFNFELTLRKSLARGDDYCLGVIKKI